MATLLELPQPRGFEQSISALNSFPEPDAKNREALISSIPHAPATGLARSFSYAAVGILLGVGIGLTVGIITTPVDRGSASSQAIVAHSSTSIVANGDSRPAAFVPLAVAPVQSASSAVQPAISHAKSTTLRLNLPVKSVRSAAIQTRGKRTLFAHKHSVRRPVHAARHTEMAAAKSVSGAALTPQRIAPVILPTSFGANPASSESRIKPSGFYTEGLLEVVDYDATTKSFETSDGRSFVIGAGDSMIGSASWQDSRVTMHYRCAQDGNCMLNRGGMASLSAKLIL